MVVNTKMRYGLRVMIELAMHSGESGLLQKDIAANQDLPVKYLDQIIAALKVAGLITNVKGKKSGYRLTRDAENITVQDVVKAFDLQPSITECVHDDENCKRSGSCAAQMFWKDLHGHLDGFLQSVTLKELAMKQDKFNEEKSSVSNYQI